MLYAAHATLHRKREQAACGQHTILLPPALHLLTADAPVGSCEGDAKCGEVVPTQPALCSTPAGAAEHLRGIRRAVMLARAQRAAPR